MSGTAAGLERQARPRRARDRGRGAARRAPTSTSDSRLRAVMLLFGSLWRLIRGEDQRGRKVRWLLTPAAALPQAGGADVRRRCWSRPPRRWLRPPWSASRPRRSPPTTPPSSELELIVAGFLAHRLLLWGASYVQTYLVGWVGQRALQDLRMRIFTHLQKMSIGFFTRNRPGRPDLADHQRRRRARPADQHRGRDAVPEHADAARRGGDHAAARRRAGAGRLPHLPAAGDRQHRLPDRRRERLPDHARADRRGDRLPAGEPERDPGRAQLRPGGAARRRGWASSTSSTARRT